MRGLAVVAAAALAVTLAGPAQAQAPAAPEPRSPTAQMRDYTNEVLRALQEATLAEGDRVAAARAAARKLAIQVFGLAEAAQAVLGRHWDARTAAEREEFIQLFADLLEASYISQLDRQQGIRIRYVGESVEGDRAEVRARLTTRKGEEAMMEARLAHREGRWLVYDVVLEGVSLMANFRAQFDRIIRRSSYEELLRTLKARREHLLGRRAPPPPG